MRISPQLLVGALLACAFSLASPWQSAIAAGQQNRPALLTSLDGHWIMIGDVMGKPVKYDMEAFPTLQGVFTEIHMKDVEVPSQYEARVFIGVAKNGKLIVHWLDSTGAANSTPHGAGSISGNTITFKIPYPSSTFRDTLTYHPDEDSWSLVLQAQQSDGAWKHFAKYVIKHNGAER